MVIIDSSDGRLNNVTAGLAYAWLMLCVLLLGTANDF